MTRLKEISGFSLIELIISITITIIVAGVVTPVINTAFRTVEAVQIRKHLVIDGAMSTSKFVREFAHIPNDQSIIIAKDDQVRFSTNLGITIEYELTNGQLTRQVIGQGAAQTLCQSVNVDSSQFRYFKRDNSELTNLPLSAPDRKEVWMIELTLEIINQDAEVHYLASVFPENLKLTGVEAEGEEEGLGGPPAPPPPGFGP